MERIVDTKEYLDTVCSLLAQGENGVPVPVAGSSMEPFLKHGDTVYLDPPGQLRAGDILLFTRPDGTYVLHRLVKRKEGRLVIRGDAQTWCETTGPESVRGTVVRVKRRGQLLGPGDGLWRFFATAWVWFWPLRPAAMKAWKRLKRLSS